MDLVNKEVIHDTFGKGNVVNYSDSYIKINFESGEKRFVFPDIFGKYITFIDKEASELVKGKLKEKNEKERRRRQILKEKRALERERQKILEQRKKMKNIKIYPEIQSVFWCNEDEEENIFTDWRVFTGEIKSGKKKGQPRKLARMTQNSACLITSRDSDEEEDKRQILGAFMTEESFNGRLCEDGYIKAHPKYKIRLSKEESEKMLFWNYYFDKKSPKKTTWNSGRQRYFDNTWMAQILRDIISLKKDEKEIAEVQEFFDYFCRINHINKDELSEIEGALTRV